MPGPGGIGGAWYGGSLDSSVQAGRDFWTGAPMGTSWDYTGWSSGGAGLRTGGAGLGTGGLGSLGSSWANFAYPTPQEVYNSLYGLPHMQAQTGILGQLGDMGSFRSAVMPEVQGVMKSLGRSGIPSSSWADRTITDTLGSLYNKWLWNALTGWQNIGAQMPSMMSQWYQPYNTMLGALGS